MTATSFYRRAAFLPIVLPLAAAVTVALIGVSRFPTSVKVRVVDVAGFVAIAGFVGLLPYALWVVIAVAWSQPETEVDYRRLSWFAPIFIAVPFGIVMGLFAMGSRSMGGAIGSFTTWAMLALAVGYFYTIVINVAFLIAKYFRWIE